MASTYPGAVDQFGEPSTPATTALGSAGDSVPARKHDEHHRDLGDAIIATQTEVDAHKAGADPHSGYVLESLFDANSIVKADADDTPVVMIVPASTVVGRKATGGIAAMTVAELKALLSCLTVGEAVTTPMKTGASRYYGSGLGILTTGALTDGVLYYVPLEVPKAITVSELYMNVTTIGAAGSLIRAGIYASDADGDPSTLVIDAGTKVGDTSGHKQWAISQALAAGRYWLAAVGQGGVAMPQVYKQDYLAGQMPVATANQMVGRGFQQTGVSGALPASATPVINDSTIPPRVLAKVA